MNELRISVSIEMGVMLDGGVVVSDIVRLYSPPEGVAQRALRRKNDPFRGLVRLAIMLVKTLTWIGFVLAICGCADRPDPINSVIGDESWTSPAPPESEQVRIATHLRFVADRLAAETPDLPAGAAAERARLIDVLR